MRIKTPKSVSKILYNYCGVKIDIFTHILDCQILTKQEKFRTLIDLKGFIWNIKIVPGADLGL